MHRGIELSLEESEKIKEVINNFLKIGTPSEHPQLIIITGPIASGKTTIRREKYSNDFVLFDSGELFDAFKAIGVPEERLEDLIMVAGLELVKGAIAEKKNIVIEITADNTDKGEKIKQIATLMPTQGYEVKIEYIDCDVEECQRRNEKGRDNVSSYYSSEETLHYFMVYLANL